ncbi:Na+/solute symporter [Tepidanaerobacter acetatoxydans Re1]|uniref:Na+/solute symporter n=1 Tax=Tepidanaerobacter acetatoxydans (strain DSM 21804 / JCM 16047 / Re1) TaxID=1209989 RepID=F4LRH1_TEPAE|nr:sodium:solute symporter family protein [Tepidanaerobacter acetatoxydans]AEE90234.1 Na+/solute symporter [Tepidanaerobacter acetatoxydans Re1]CCP24696.1 Na+/solute symporter [Tepidanaerobacter acetatoxydans Re1]
MSLGTLLWMATIVLGIFFLWISFKVSHKASASFADYSIAGGSLPLFLIFFTEFANIMGVGNFVGHAAKGYANGLPWLFFILGEQGSKIIFALIFAGFAGRFTYNTYIEMIDDLIVKDKVTRVIAAILACSIMIAWTGGQAKGFGSIFHVITGANPVPIVFLFTAIYIIYTTVGGYYSLVWMDFVLGLLVIVFGSMFYFEAFKAVNFSFAEIGTRLAAMGKAEMWSLSGADYSVALANFVTGCVGILAAQMYWQSCFAAKDSRTARNGLLSSGTIAIIFVMLTAIVGMIIYTINPNLTGEDPMPWFMMNMVPTTVAVGIFMCIMAAGMSSADSNLNSATVLMTNDIVAVFKPDLTDAQLVTIVRALTVIVGILAAVISIYSDSILGLFSRAYSMAGGGLVPLLIVGLLWKERPDESFEMGKCNSKVTPWGARVGMIVGAVLSQIDALGTFKILIALGVSALLIIVISMFTRTSSNSVSA